MVAKYGVTIAAAVCAFFIYTGIYDLDRTMPFVSLIPAEDVRGIRGRVLSDPKKNSSGTSYRILIQPDYVRGRTYPDTEGIFGARGCVTVIVPAEIVESGYPGGLYSRRAAGSDSQKDNILFIEKGSSLTASVLPARATGGESDIFFADPGSVKQLPYDRSLAGHAAAFRAQCRIKLRQILYAWDGAGGLALALLAGSTDMLERGLSDMFRKSGLAHVLALSGMHLALFSGMAVFAAKKLGLYLSAAAAACTAALFLWFAGPTPSLVRAALCLYTGMAAGFAGKKLPPLNTVSLAFLLHVLIAPQQITELSCILSYGALAGILTGGKYAERFLLRFSMLPRKAASGLGASCGAQLLTFPISLSVFGTAAPFGILASVIIAPFIAAFMICSLAGAAASLVFPQHTILWGLPARCLYMPIEAAVQFFSRFPLVTLH